MQSFYITKLNNNSEFLYFKSTRVSSLKQQVFLLKFVFSLNTASCYTFIEKLISLYCFIFRLQVLRYLNLKTYLLLTK